MDISAIAYYISQTALDEDVTYTPQVNDQVFVENNGMLELLKNTVAGEWKIIWHVEISSINPPLDPLVDPE